jgi:hypothetical protein
MLSSPMLLSVRANCDRAPADLAGRSPFAIICFAVFSRASVAVALAGWVAVLLGPAPGVLLELRKAIKEFAEQLP